jgi:DNA-directed RNA polymerase subunit M/transcription elongation factor TFIIS
MINFSDIRTDGEPLRDYPDDEREERICDDLECPSCGEFRVFTALIQQELDGEDGWGPGYMCDSCGAAWRI